MSSVRNCVKLPAIDFVSVVEAALAPVMLVLLVLLVMPAAMASS
ncbi:hypothetical protein M2440_002528 [Methylorubrum extorquens]|nr:hypothetical protein [Methylorubrum extorquens]